ncbi:hypothetical protein EYV94_24290 [Puteibacter caeruleilacunae]|nr:hypothetical protein EYV94_24290 [Puteibacter caeruleilacunae]
MGIIQKQTIKGSIFSYLGVAIGYIYVILLMPKFFTKEEIGLTQLFASISAIFALFGTLGFVSVTNRLFPYFKNEDNKHNGFSFLVILTTILGFTAVISAFLILKPWVIERNIEKSPLLVEYLYFLIPLIFFRLFFTILDGYNKALLDAVTGTFWTDFGFKMLNLIFICMFCFRWIDFRTYMFCFVFALSFPAIPVLFKLIRTHNISLKPQLGFINKGLFKEMLSIGFFGILGSSSGIVVTNIDRIMANEYLALGATGVFSVCALFGSILRIPNASLNKIATPLIADAWKDNNLQVIDSIYRKSTINQLIIGTLLFVGIYSNLDNIFIMLGPEYTSGRNVVTLYSLAFLITIVNGAGPILLSTSHKYKVQTVFMVIVSVLTIIFNMIFIPIYGIDGVALATVLTYLTTLIFRVTYIKMQFNLFPFNHKHLLTIAMGIISYLPAYFIPQQDWFVADIIIRSAAITIVFVGGTYLFRLSDDINNLIINTIRQISNMISKK